MNYQRITEERNTLYEKYDFYFKHAGACQTLWFRRECGKSCRSYLPGGTTGEFTAIVGRSGSGKSTLLHLLGGLDRPDSGKVFIEGKDIFSLKDEELAVFRRRKIGFIFQDYNLVPSLNVWENIVLPIGLDGKKADREFVTSVIESIGIADKIKALPGTLSGGQQQRVAIARALASRPAIILADEPTGNLDSRTEMEVISLLKSCVADYCQTLVMITHDETVAQMADRILIIEDGRVVANQ